MKIGISCKEINQFEESESYLEKSKSLLEGNIEEKDEIVIIFL